MQKEDIGQDRSRPILQDKSSAGSEKLFAGGNSAYPVPRVAVDPSENWINLFLYIVS